MTVLVVLESRNGNDLSSEDLDSLASELSMSRSISPDTLDIRIDVKPTFGSGNAWFDSVWVWLPTAELIREHIYGPAMDSMVDYMKRRFKRKHEEGRPRRIILLYGPDREVLKEITIEDPNVRIDSTGERV